MHVLKSTLLTLTVLFFSYSSRAQQLFCPENSGFEYGNFSNWLLYTGSCCPIVANNLTGPLPNRHVITNGGVDPYGFFPAVAPGGGNHSMKLGNDNVNSQAEKARFYVQVPAGNNNYSLIYRYAVVFEDPGHLPQEQPRFEVVAYDSATNQILPCAHFVYVAGPTIPGFLESTIADSVWYKTWTTATLDLSGWEGHTIRVEFSTGDCDLGAHFGYGYVDMSCGLFQVAGNACGSTTTTFTAPPGFEFYTWYDSSFSTIVGSGQVVTINTPPNTSTYQVILTPYSGYGCPDTLTTTLAISNIQLTASNDTLVCYGSTVPLQSNALGNMAPFTYNWTPSTGLSCTNCPNPVLTATTSANYVVTVTDTSGCTRMDTVHVEVSPATTINLTPQNVNCNNANNGSITAGISGSGPFTYSWNTGQTTQSISGLSPGTYTLTVINSLGCPQTASATITQPQVLSVSLSSTPASCNGLANGTATATVTGGTAPYTYSWNTGQTTAFITGLGAGPKTVTVTDAHGCITSGTVNIVQPAVLATITNITHAYCSNLPIGSATVSASGGTPPYTYSWNTIPVQTTPTANNLGNGTYIVTVTDVNGCMDTAHATVIQTPGLSITPSSTNVICNGQGNGTASVVANNGVSPFTYTWSNGQTTSSVSGLLPGIYTVNVSDNTGCNSNATFNITQPSVLNALLANVNNVSCFGLGNGSATVAVLGGSPGYTYQWNTTPVQTTPQASNLQPGTYTVTVTDTHGCIDTAQATIQQPTPLTVAINNPTNATCGLPNGSATATPTGGTGPYTYSWSTTPVQTGSTANNLNGGTYTVTVTDSKGCIATASVTITQTPAVFVTTQMVNISCHGMNDGSVTATISGGTQPTTYTWSNGQTGLTQSPLSAGNYTIIVTDNIGCHDTAVANISQPPVLVTNIANIENIKCYGDQNGSISVTASGGTAPYNYSWNNGGTGANPNNLDTGTFTVIITDAHGCADTQTAHISQPPQILIAANALTATCMNEANGSADVVVNGGIPPYSFTWNTNPPQTGTTANGLIPGSYIVTVTDSNGCQRTDDVTITGLPLPEVNAGPDHIYCYGKDTITLTASGAQTYEWTPTNSVTCSTCATTLANPNSTTTFTVTGTDQNGCRDADEVTVTVYTREAVSTGGDIDICIGDKASLSATGIGQHTWYPQPDNTETGLSVSPDSTTVYTVVIVQNQCFTDTLTQKVIVHYPPTVELGPDMRVLPGTIVDIHADTTNGKSITWDPITNLSCDDCIDPSARIDETITYTATVYNKACKAVDDITFTISCDGGNIFMANTFTPNGDGNNDVFFPQTPGRDIIKVFRVYNRWGQKLHEAVNFFSNDPNFGWDGTFEGKSLSPDVYVYFLETSCPGGEKVFKKGDISLIK